jgi:hypothetical protein
MLKVTYQLHASAALPPGNVPPVYAGQEAGWATEPVWAICIYEHIDPIGSRSQTHRSTTLSHYL